MGYFSDIFKSDDAPVESDDLEQTAGFWSDERGQQRSRDLNDAIKYYLGPYLGSSDGLVAKGGQLANPIVGLQDSGVAFKEGRYVDAVTDLAGAAVPLAAGVVAKPAARAVSKGMDDAVDMVSETLTGFSAKPKPFDPSRRKAMQQMGAAAVAAPVLASDATRGVLEEVIAPIVKKTAGSTPLTAAFEKLMTNKSSMENILEQENSIFRNMRQSDPYMNTPLTPDQNTLLNSLANTRNTINRDIITSIDEIVGNVDPSSVKGLSDTDLNSLLEEVSNRTWTIDPDIADVDVVIDLMVHDVDLAILFNGNVKYIKSYGYKKFGKIFYVTAILQHENGVFSRILTSRITQKKIRLINVVIKNKYIECVGRVDRDEVEKFYSKAHFVVFFRENMRYAKAGFPSKSIESWQHGIPIITNNVGELKNYLKNGVNSFVLENNQQSILNLANKLNLMISSKNYPLMVENSLKTFNDNFDLLKFKSEFLIYIESLK